MPGAGSGVRQGGGDGQRQQIARPVDAVWSGRLGLNNISADGVAHVRMPDAVGELPVLGLTQAELAPRGRGLPADMGRRAVMRKEHLGTVQLEVERRCQVQSWLMGMAVIDAIYRAARATAEADERSGSGHRPEPLVARGQSVGVGRWCRQKAR